MKLVSVLLLSSVALGLAGCNTLNTRRDLYSPTKGKGYWTTRFWKQRETEGIYGVSNSYQRGAGPGPQTGIFGISHPDY